MLPTKLRGFKEDVAGDARRRGNGLVWSSLFVTLIVQGMGSVIVSAQTTDEQSLTAEPYTDEVEEPIEAEAEADVDVAVPAPPAELLDGTEPLTSVESPPAESDASGLPDEAVPQPPEEATAVSADSPSDAPGYEMTSVAVPPGQARSYEREPGVEPEDVLLAIPRALFLIPRLALDLVFWPITEFVDFLDRRAVIPWVERLLYWNDDQTAGWLPTAAYDSVYGLSYGLSVFHNDLAGHDESLSVSARAGGRFSYRFQLRFEGERVGGTRLWVDAAVRAEAKPSLIFDGIGAGTSSAAGSNLDPRGASTRSRFTERRVLAVARVGVTLGRRGALFKFGAYGVFNHRRFGPSDHDSDPSTDDVYDTSLLPGFDTGAITLEFGGTFIVDSRVGAGLDSRGVYLEAFAGYAPDVDGFRYGHFGADFTWTINLYRNTRLLVLRAGIEGLQASDEHIPFTDLARLGGADRLRGYRGDAYRDRLASFAMVEYRYPIHRNLMGYVFVDAGYVASDFVGLFDDVLFGGGGGLLVGSESSLIFRLDVGYGDGIRVNVSTDIARAFQQNGEQL